MTVTLTKHIGEIYISFEGETAAEVVELYEGYMGAEYAAKLRKEAALRPVEPDEGWTVWNGGICPIAPESARVDLKMRDGQTRKDVDPHIYIWKHPAIPSTDKTDIVAYRVVTP